MRAGLMEHASIGLEVHGVLDEEKRQTLQLDAIERLIVPGLHELLGNGAPVGLLRQGRDA